MPVLPPLPDRIGAIAAPYLPPEPLDSPPLRWAILGAGGIAHKFVRDIERAGSRVIAVGSRTPGKATAFAAAAHVPCAGSYEDVVARDDVDAVYVATTHNFHAAAAKVAMSAGKPVLIEKPIAPSARELADVRRAAEAAGVLVMEAMWSRFLPHYAIIRAFVESGTLGRVTYVRAEHSQRLRGVARMEDPNLAGGAALDLGVYPASFIHWILGKPTMVQAAGHLTDRGVDADGIAMLSYPHANAVYEASMQVKMVNSAVVAFERGRIELPYEFYRLSEIRVVWDEGSDLYQEVWSMKAIENYGFEYEGAAFARALATGQTEVSGHGWQDAAEVIEILDRIRSDIGVVQGE